MAISLVTPGAVATNATSALTLAAGTDGASLGTGFAGLLNGQLGGLDALLAKLSVSAQGTSAATAKTDLPSANKDDPASDGQQPADILASILAVQSAPPVAAPPVSTPASSEATTPDALAAPGTTAVLIPPALASAPGIDAGKAVTQDKGTGGGFALPDNRAPSANLAATVSASLVQDVQPGTSGPAMNDTGTMAIDALVTPAALAGNDSIQLAAAGQVAVPPTHAQAAHHTDPSNNPTVSTPLQAQGWNNEFSEKIVWMARQDQQTAQININPPQLGPVQITLNLNGDQANALFVSPHAEVRQAIEDALPRLREMLAGAGIDLGQANVGSQLAQQQPNGSNASQSPDTPRYPGDNAILKSDTSAGGTTSVELTRSGRGMVDLFA